MKNLIAFFTLMAMAFVMVAPPAKAQSTYTVPPVVLTATNGGFGTSANGTFTLLNATTNTSGVMNVTKARDVTLYCYFDAMNTNAANSNIVFTCYVSQTNGSALSGGYWARASAYDWTNSFNGSSSVSNYITFTSLGGVGYMYWKLAYTGANIGTNFVFTGSAKNGL